jgi:hypothetical protein
MNAFSGDTTMMKRTLAAAILCTGMVFGLAAESYASISEAAVLFLRIAAGARPAGMGEAFVAVADDATATHWNPAGLGRYPLSDLWLDLSLPQGYTLQDFAVIENDVPEMNYTHYDVWALARSGEGAQAELMRTTPPNHLVLTKGGGRDDRGRSGSWARGDVYEPDATENLVSVVRTRTGLPEGPELDERVKQVAALNQIVTTDSLRAWWVAMTELPGGQIGDSLVVAFDKLLAANDRLNVEPGYLRDLLDEMSDAVRDQKVDADESFRMQVLAQRATVTYLPERIHFPFSFNLTGEVTTMASHKQTLWLGTTRGLLRHTEGRWLAVSDSTAGPALGRINDMAIAPSGALWVATDSGVSRYTSTWKHFGSSDGWALGAAKKIFVLGEYDVFASDGVEVLKYDEPSKAWSNSFTYQAGMGDHLAALPAKLLDVRDSVQMRAFGDSLIICTGLALESLEANTKVRIPYRLAMRGKLNAMARTSDGALWFGTDAGLVSLSANGYARHYGYAYESITEPTTLLAVATKYVGPAREERAQRLAERIKTDNQLESDTVDAGRTLRVFNGVTGAAIHSLHAEGGSLLAGTEFGVVEYAGENRWYRYINQGLEESRVRGITERAGERWFADDHRVVIYAHPRKEATLMHVKWLPELASDLYYEYGAFVTQIKGWGTVGANITFLSLGKQLGTSERGDTLGEFGTFELAAGLSYGTRLSRSLTAGVSAKLIYSHLSDFGAGAERGGGTATAFAADFGALWQTPLRRLTLGLAVTNLGPNISYIDAAQADPLPRNLGLGFAYRIVSTPYNRLTLIGEVNKDLIGLPENFTELREEMDEAIFNGGLEYQYGSFIALRGGYIYDREGAIKTPTVGAGLQYRHWLFDFAYIPSSDTQVLANTTRFALSARF